ncbi:hypothetical protein D9M68_862950 [compost metagenome]
MISLGVFIWVNVSGNFGPLMLVPQAVVNISTPRRSDNDCRARTGAVPRLPEINFTLSLLSKVWATFAPSAALYLLSYATHSKL